MPDHIFLYGPPGVGKTTIGDKLAERLTLPFVDLDLEIERNYGSGVPKIFSEIGERGFREIETVELAATINRSPSVIALGGGALIDPRNRRIAEEHGVVISLSAEFETLLDRTENSQDYRPLIADGREKKLAELLNNRQDHYQSFSRTIVTDMNSIEDIIWECLILAGRYRLSGMGSSYEVAVRSGAITAIDRYVPALENNSVCYLISDTTVAGLYGDQFAKNSQINGQRSTPVFVVPASERAKSIKWVSAIWNFLLDHRADRDSTILALGGGVVGDLAGFAAASYMRGIKWINIPTTLLAMVDAGIGGKTGINLARGKNLIGAFYPPLQVIIDPGVLSTLGARDFSSGMAEVIKHALIGEPNLLRICNSGPNSVWLNLEEMISRAASVKIRIVETDPFEQSIRKALNLGHTIGHAVEKASSFRLTHGEAVSIGLVTETFLAEKIGIARPGLHQEIANLLEIFNLPVMVPSKITTDSIIQYTRVDKKKSGETVLFPLLAEIGEIKLDIVVQDLEPLITEFRKQPM